jgi:hypothetical protein
VPSHLTLVGYGPEGADVAAGRARVIIRDIANTPVANATVRLDFSACTDLRIAATQVAPNEEVNCGLHSVRSLTDPSGVAEFTITGGGRGGTGHGVQMVDVYWDDYWIPPQDGLIGRVRVSAFDLDGVGGVNALDMMLWAADYFGGANPGRSDYDGDSLLSALDLSRSGSMYFGAGGVWSGTDYCP